MNKKTVRLSREQRSVFAILVCVVWRGLALRLCATMVTPSSCVYGSGYLRGLPRQLYTGRLDHCLFDCYCPSRWTLALGFYCQTIIEVFTSSYGYDRHYEGDWAFEDQGANHLRPFF